jgi:hypothetical protein
MPRRSTSRPAQVAPRPCRGRPVSWPPHVVAAPCRGRPTHDPRTSVRCPCSPQPRARRPHALASTTSPAVARLPRAGQCRLPRAGRCPVRRQPAFPSEVAGSDLARQESAESSDTGRDCRPLTEDDPLRGPPGRKQRHLTGTERPRSRRWARGRWARAAGTGVGTSGGHGGGHERRARGWTRGRARGCARAVGQGRRARGRPRAVGPGGGPGRWATGGGHGRWPADGHGRRRSRDRGPDEARRPSPRG